MNYKRTIPLLFLIFTTLILGCDKDETKPKVETFLCCGDNPFSSLNINNTQDEIIFPNVFTPNNDGYNDFFIIPILANYPNHSVVIYDLNDKVVYEDVGLNVWFNGVNQNTGDELKFGSYKYKIVIENEQTFLQFGYLCLIRKKSEANGFDFSNCYAPQTTISGDAVLAN